MTSPNANIQSVVAPTRSAKNRKLADFQQTVSLLRLEQKYGKTKNIRIESAHTSAVPAPKTRASEFHQYVGWLSQNAKGKSKVAQRPSAPRPAVKTVSTAKPADLSTADAFAKNLKFASPDILATVATKKKASTKKASTRKVPAKKNVTTKGSLAIPVDKSSQSLERLTRIDVPTAKQAKAKPNFAKRKKAIRVTTKWKTSADTLQEPGKPKPITSTPPANLPTAIPLPAKLVAWEVDDFEWPSVLTEKNTIGSATAANITTTVKKMLATGNQRLAVVGSGRGPGTTTIAAYVARVLAAQDKSVLLVDADLSKPDLTKRLGIPANLSWTNVVSLQRTCSEAIIQSCNTGVCLMPLAKLGNRVAYPEYLYDRLGGVLDGIKSHFDFVIIDAGPTSQLVRELRRPNVLADAVMLVHNVRTPDRSTYIRNQNELNSFGVKNIVVAENFTATKSA